MNSYSSVRVFVTLIIIIMTIVILLPTSSFGAVLTPSRPIKDGDILISANGNFALGFFSPAGTSSDHRYLGIWYNKIPETTVVWVANRESPVRGKTGVLTVDQSTRGLSIYGHEDDESPIWSSAKASQEKNVSLSAELLDVGNLVLSGEDGSLLWQSFDHPTDTMLPFMTIGVNRVTGWSRFLNSWKAPGDPGPGNFTLGIDTAGHPQLFLEENGVPRWRGGPWTGHRWAGVPEMTPNFILNVSYVEGPDSVSITYGILNQSIFSRMVLDQSGVVYRSTWHGPERGWIQFWSAPSHLCDNYGQCGANGYCDPLDSNIRSECTCLPGFEPKESREWDLRDWSGGCLRERALGCGDGDGFVKLERVKVPDMSLGVQVVGSGMSLEACEEKCRGNCSCVAYARANESSGGSGCVTWYGNMVDTRSFTTVGQQLYVRVDAITLAKYKRNSSNWLSLKVKLAIALSCTVIVLLLLIVVFALARKKRKVKHQQPRFYTVSMDTSSPAFSQDMHSKRDLGESRSNSELPLFNLNTIAAATDNFSYQNKLGEGGFGPVYKGMLSDGKEIAVKRLSKHSGQGTEEFKNELLLIANLQHRNLVRILGCCVQGDEKMIIYEYLPNKSLDFCIFDETKKTAIDWKKRFEIICGIARGLLYLHQDSRLRIIHRDLKASNILLDADMNPKIADFGMARIFGGDQNEANTNRVVGTYGYMSPEYAMGGRFSTKSDVYSFGVLLLEIVTGKKNTSYFPEYPDSNLVGYVWELWTRGKALELVDPCLDECYAGEALRCIEIGLLCVQDYAADRPNMSTVVFMLGNETAVPKPKQPAFVFKTSHTKGDLSISEGAESINDVTCTIVEAR